MLSKSVAVYFSPISLARSLIPSLLVSKLNSNFQLSNSACNSGYRDSKYFFMLSSESEAIMASLMESINSCFAFFTSSALPEF